MALAEFITVCPIKHTSENVCKGDNQRHGKTISTAATDE